MYQLDDGPFQESPVFENVSLGTHSITVQDKNGCSPPITRNDVLVINYPKFFTPNNDGYNDTWNIFSLQDQSNSRILIFDRYGKFLKEITPNGQVGTERTTDSQCLQMIIGSVLIIRNRIFLKSLNPIFH